MIFTAVMVIATDFLTGVLAAMVMYGVLFKVFDTPAVHQEAEQTDVEPLRAAG